MKLRGIHHITAIASEPQPNLDFYAGALALRFVKRTVNFDDPGAYHFYFGDRTGRPGTAITFFPWPGARRGSRGAGQVTATSFAIPPNALEFWKARFKDEGVVFEQTSRRFGDEVLRLADPDGLPIELITSAELDHVDLAYRHNNVPNEFAIRGFHAPTLAMRRLARSEKLLQRLGFELQSEENGRRRFAVNARSTSGKIDIVEGAGEFGLNSAGTVHHIAFRCADEAGQIDWRNAIVDLGLFVTPVIDRQYFHSIYFREPNGILFEIATDGPGFTADEPAESLGQSLKLPPQYESQRAEIERILPPISLDRA